MLGFEGIDIGLFQDRSHLQPSHVLPNLAKAAGELTGKLRDNGLKLADLFHQNSSFDKMAANDPDPGEQRKSREMFLHMLEFAQLCHAPHMTALPGVEWPGEPRDSSLKRCADELAWRAEQARQAGVVYSIEAHRGSIVPTPALAKQLVDMAPGLTLTLDYTHFLKQGYDQDECEALMPYASHYHARGANHDRIQVKMQDNIIDFERVLKAMERANYKGYVGVEYVWQEWEQNNEVDTISESIQLRDRLRAAMQ
jgi:sugar phosphate isomerase/epimerase